MTILITIARQIGIAGCCIVGLIIFYEGLPLVSSIPLIGNIPIIGDLAVGRVERAAIAARQGYVALAEKTALEAQLAEQERQRLAAAQSLEEYRKRLSAAVQAKEEANAKLEKIIADDSGSDGAVWDQSDIEWLSKH